MSGIYIHIPFCRQACSYCDFYFVTRDGLRGEFVERLCEEIEQYRESRYSGEIVRTVYIGGGTPSLLPLTDVEKILEKLREIFYMEPEEVTMELNPDDVSRPYLQGLRSAGVNRASLGVQTFDPDRLRFMHRAHDPGQAEQAMADLHLAGFERFTADLIYGNPGQTPGELEMDIDKLLSFDPPHISAYSLTVEPGTRLGKQAELGRLQPADEGVVSQQFQMLGERLGTAGLQRYEVSNYSRPSFEALHNTSYWSHENYIGLGPSAHSFWKNDQGAERWKIASDLKQYLSRPFSEAVAGMESLSMHTLAEERIILGLRTRWGVEASELSKRYGYRLSARQQEWLEKRSEEEVLDWDGERILFLEPGLQIADHLIVELLTRQ